MNYNNIVDMHTHSAFSFDGNDSCSALCESAYSKGAKAIAITDHCDIDGADINVHEFCSAQLKELESVKGAYSGRLKVMKGIEIGQGIYRKELTERVLCQYDYDFVLGSLHNLENMEDFFFLNYKNYDVYELLQRYFEDLYELADWGAFDALAHLTYPLRYIAAREKISVDMSKFDNIIDSIFEKLVSNKKALEINTSGLFMEMKDTLPNISYVKQFKRAGGEYITLGSDSHYAKKVCQGIDIAMKLAYDAGFRSITVYKKHQPVLMPIE